MALNTWVDLIELAGESPSFYSDKSGSTPTVTVKAAAQALHMKLGIQSTNFRLHTVRF